jgi:hypothetical protein
MHIEYQRTVKVEPLNVTENFCRPSQVRKRSITGLPRPGKHLIGMWKEEGKVTKFQLINLLSVLIINGACLYIIQGNLH